MRKFITRVFLFLGVITLLFLVFLGAGVGYGFYLRSSLAPSAKTYADESVRAIITTWSKDELIQRSSPELRATTTKGQLDQVFASLTKLGSLQTYKEAEGDVGISFSNKRGLIVKATYVASATFQHGRADIKIELIRHANVWQILGFHVDPPAP